MGRIIPRLTSGKSNCCRFAPRTGPALVTSKSELFRARSLLRGSRLDEKSAMVRHDWRAVRLSPNRLRGHRIATNATFATSGPVDKPKAGNLADGYSSGLPTTWRFIVS